MFASSAVRVPSRRAPTRTSVVDARRRPAHQELVRPRQHQPHRPAQPQCEQGDQGFQQHDLPAEAAAHLHRDHPHGGDWQPEQSSDVVAGLERALGGRPDHDSRALRRGRHRVGLKEALMHARHLIARLDHLVRLGQSGLNVTPAVAADGAHVAWLRLTGLLPALRAAVDRGVVEALSILVQYQGRIGLHRCEGVGHGRHWVEVEVDPGRAVGGGRLRVRDHGRRRLAREVDALPRQGLVRSRNRQCGQVATGDHRPVRRARPGPP
jgi:hypothetical protein